MLFHLFCSSLFVQISWQMSINICKIQPIDFIILDKTLFQNLTEKTTYDGKELIFRFCKDSWEPGSTSCGHARPLGNRKPLFFLEIQCQWKHAVYDHLHSFKLISIIVCLKGGKVVNRHSFNLLAMSIKNQPCLASELLLKELGTCKLSLPLTNLCTLFRTINNAACLSTNGKLTNIFFYTKNKISAKQEHSNKSHETLTLKRKRTLMEKSVKEIRFDIIRSAACLVTIH